MVSSNMFQRDFINFYTLIPFFIVFISHFNTATSVVVNMSLVHDDIILSPKQIQMRKYNGAKNVAIKEKGNNRWENNIIPYRLSNSYTVSEKLIIENSLKAIEKVSCFRFPIYTNQRNFLDIDKQNGCYSYVGKIGGRQLLSLSEGCVYDFIVIHEVMHVLGLEHEHQRPDRDRYIKIQYQNVESDKMANFGLISPNDVDYNSHPYDYQSIMHYDGTAFGKRDQSNGKKLVTMVPLKDGIKLHDNFELTTLDIAKLNSLGKCSETVAERFTNGACSDKGVQCDLLLKNGICKNAAYKKLVLDHCALTCGYCTPKFEHSPMCEDKIPNCSMYVANGICNSKFYDTSLCAKSCNKC